MYDCCLSSIVMTFIDYLKCSWQEKRLRNLSKGMKTLGNSFIYDCCVSSIVMTFIDYLKCRWQENRHLNMSKRREMFRWQLYIRLLYVINCQNLHRLMKLEITGKGSPQFCRKDVKYFGYSFSYDCCISSIVSIFIDCLKWKWQEKRHLILSKGHEVFQQQLSIWLLYIIFFQEFRRIFEMEMTGKATVQFVERACSVSAAAFNTIAVYHQFSGISSIIWNGFDRKSDTSIGRKNVKSFSNSFI